MATGSQFALVAAAAAVPITDLERHLESRSVLVSNSGANPAQLGGPSVAAAGFTIGAGVTLSFSMSDGDQLFAFSTLGTTLQVLTSP